MMDARRVKSNIRTFDGEGLDLFLGHVQLIVSQRLFLAGDELVIFGEDNNNRDCLMAIDWSSRNPH